VSYLPPKHQCFRHINITGFSFHGSRDIRLLAEHATNNRQYFNTRHQLIIAEKDTVHGQPDTFQLKSKAWMAVAGRFITGRFITGRFSTVGSSHGRFITPSTQHLSILHKNCFIQL